LGYYDDLTCGRLFKLWNAYRYGKKYEEDKKLAEDFTVELKSEIDKNWVLNNSDTKTCKN
jgi:hypothetical protein